MLRSIIAIFLLITLCAGVDAAPRKKKRKAPKAKARTEKVKEPKAAAAKADDETPKDSPLASDEAAPANNGEMDAYRAIQDRSESTVQDLADLILMYKGDYAKFATPEKRLTRARELKIVKSQKGSDRLERGALAYAIMNVYEPEKGVFFWLTGWERYAMRDVQEAGIMPARTTPTQNMSGEQLLGTITAAEDFSENRKKWGEKK